MKPRTYVETSVLSYLAARPAKDLIRAAHQKITGLWWAERQDFELFISEFVLSEAQKGHPDAARKRLALVPGIPILVATNEARVLARALLTAAAMPSVAALDAAHVAVASVHGMDLLVTWNCTHIANAVMRHRIEAVIRDAGYEPPTICTPDEIRTQEAP